MLQANNIIDYSKFRLPEADYNTLKGSQWPTYEEFTKTQLENLIKIVPNKLIETEILHYNNLLKPVYRNDMFFDTMWYNKELYPYLKIKFNNSELIDENCSHAWQDMMILTLLNGKSNGTYLELGASRPCFINNTFLLEYLFNWRGISIDIIDYSQSWKSRPNSNFMCSDVLSIDYAELLQKNYLNTQIDYLQIDVDQSPAATNKLLSSILLTDKRFSIITFETNAGHEYWDNLTHRSYLEKSRKLLSDCGYILLISDILHYMPDTPNNRNGKWMANEDLWVDPAVIDSNLIEYFLNIKEKNPFDILIGQ